MESLKPILANYRNLLAAIDGWFAGCLRAAPQHIACRAGCSACCRGLFDITLLDAFLLKQAFDRLPDALRRPALAKAATRLAELRRRWPGFGSPFLLNGMPDAEWTEMPEEDETPCPLLGADGRCLVYAARPMTCRLHGLPNIDRSGESLSDACCTRNFLEADPLTDPDLRWPFRTAFAREIDLFRDFARVLTGRGWLELDTFIPTALLIDFAAIDWHSLVLADPRNSP
jgi:Fe-S-cluster containining protein